MELLLIRHLWGVTQPWETCIPEFRQLGYRGVEAPIPEGAERARLTALLAEHRLEFLPMIFTRGETPDQNAESFHRQVEDALTFKPRLITCHSGRDAWDDAENMRFYEAVVRIEEQTGAAVAHETHRKRAFFNPWITSRILKRLPSLRVCCDLSHWVCVCERLLEDCESNIEQAASHCLHTHARVGYAEGPQVPDPRGQEWAGELAAHERWWSMIWDAQQKKGMATSTLTPEFGPPPYLHTLPHTNVPVADLADICDWMARRQAERFASRRR